MFFPLSKVACFIEKYGLDQYLNINYIEEAFNIYLEESVIDFTKPTDLTGTVVLTAVLLAIYMGFSEIYLLGCDCTDIFTAIGAKIKDTSMTEYAWDNEKNDHNRMQNTLGQRSLESIYHVQYTKFKNFRIINDICNLNQVKLYNCTKGGLLDCVNRMNFEDLFR